MIYNTSLQCLQPDGYTNIDKKKPFQYVNLNGLMIFGVVMQDYAEEYLCGEDEW